MATVKVKNNNGEWVDVALANTKGTFPEEALIISDNCDYMFKSNKFKWYIDSLGDKITTKDIISAISMFQSTKFNTIPFTLNFNNANSLNSMFYQSKIEKAPNATFSNMKTHIKVNNIFSSCYYLKEVPEWFGDLLEIDYNISGTNSNFGLFQDVFAYCFSIRKIPDKVMKYLKNKKITGHYYTLAYQFAFKNMASLDELINIYPDDYTMTSSIFSNDVFTGLRRVKNITFAVDDNGMPYTRNWKQQTLRISYGEIGYAPNTVHILDYNSGITADKEVVDDATYQALKNDPDWFTTKIEYSRYNHDSAVNTINSLPDTSAYLAANGGTNTITFRGAAGSATDGGAINTLTEEEIAVATAKGWTVSLV